MKRIVALLLFAVAAIHLSAQQPADLKFEIRTATGSTRFQVGEVIPLELVFSSTTPGRYLEPCMYLAKTCFGYPQCRFANRWKFTITPEDGWTDLQSACASMSGPTFVVTDHDLTAQPMVYRYELTNRFRFDKPGKYTVRFDLDIGLDDDSNPRPEMWKATPSGAHHAVNTSAEIQLEIVPANPQWESEVIRRGMEAFSHDEPPRTEPITPAFVQYQRDTTALCELGTPAAARALADLWLQQRPRVAGCLARSASRNDGILEMERLVSDPGTAVTPAFFTELVTLRSEDENDKDRAAGFEIIQQRDVDLERERLIDALPKKHGEALVTSLVAVLHNPPTSPPRPGEMMHALPFGDSVIALVAANLDQFPREEQEWLLRDNWDLVRSPVMLPALRALAENHIGYAVLRWQELDPATANAFVKKEILSPEPHYSSFFLRLPQPLTAPEQKQLATNFFTLANQNHWLSSTIDHDHLVRIGTFLHRYGTRAVLPALLPVIDAQRNAWPCAISYPMLAYLLKVSPAGAAPRVAEAVAQVNHGPCNTSLFFTELGFLEHGPVMDKLAFAQLSDQPGPFAMDAARYLQRYASASEKEHVWERLQYWYGRAGRLPQQTDPSKATQEDYVISTLSSNLLDAFIRAQNWIITPEDQARLKTLLTEKGLQNQVCTFACGAELAVSQPRIFSIYESPAEGHFNRAYIMDYLDNPSRHRYSIRQYSCPDVKTLEQKLLQFPAGSSFEFAGDFTPRDRRDLVEIGTFLRSHGYRVDNTQHWDFLEAANR